jgi:quinol-cytochrome oxidoreductase complex cytochrome b subunit
LREHAPLLFPSHLFSHAIRLEELRRDETKRKKTKERKTAPYKPKAALAHIASFFGFFSFFLLLMGMFVLIDITHRQK